MRRTRPKTPSLRSARAAGEAPAADLRALRAALDRLGAPPSPRRPGAQAPMLATLVDEPPAEPGWIFEIKWDGVRVLAERDGDEVTLRGRSGQDFTGRYPEVVEALRALPLDRFLIDGEVVALDAEGRASFQRLQMRMHLTHSADVARARAALPVTAIFFDALHLDGRDLRALPLADRKACLALLLPRTGAARYGDHVDGDGRRFLEAACAHRVEGIVAKRADSPYTGARSRAWLKIKCHLRQEFVIGGYTDPQGTRPYFGALHLGLYEDGRLVYVSKVGTGFDDRTLADLWRRLRPLARARSPFDAGTPGGRGHHWVEPRLVCEVRFTEWTEDGGIRHPTYMGLRPDKRPEECRRETPVDVETVTGAGGSPAREKQARRKRANERATRPARRTGADRDPAPPGVTITNASKIFWPEEGLTKGDLAAYYERIAPLMLPYLRDRPVVLVRHPDGIHGKSFYQKDAPPSTPSWVRTVALWSEETQRDIDYMVVDGADALRFVVNLGAIPLHVWHSRVASIEAPDWLVLDLDPKEAPFAHVVRVALAVRAVLDRLGLPSYPKTSGATGLHVLVPMGARHPYAQVRALAEILAAMVAHEEPRIATVARRLRDRGGKVYVDWGQNGQGQTIVAPFAVRARPGATVSCPLRWDEVGPDLDPRAFTMRTVPDRFERMADPMAPVLGEGADLAAALARLERALGRPLDELRSPPGRARGSGARRRGRSRTPRA